MNIKLPPRSAWSIPDDVIYFNHGSFGPAPRVVQEAREEFSRRLECQPMDFYLKQMEPALDQAMSVLAKFVGAEPRDMVFVDNATVAMNIVAETADLQAGDEVLLNDHEYGAVFRIWRRKCERVGARVVNAQLGAIQNDSTPSTASVVFGPPRLSNANEICNSLFQAVTDRTKLIVVSHVASPSAIVLPVTEICRQARERGVPVCIDGPHAIAMRHVNLREIDCDYYCASLHKWLSAPFGSGFLYIKRKLQRNLQPHMTSWGRSLAGLPERWQDQFNWLGTRDPAPFLAVPAAIEFLEQTGLEPFRQWTHHLAQSARQQLEQLFGQTAWMPDSLDWYGSMVTVPLPIGGEKRAKPNSMHPLQQKLRERFQIEIPITECRGQSLLRVSCHLYNTLEQIEYLINALKTVLTSG